MNSIYNSIKKFIDDVLALLDINSDARSIVNWLEKTNSKSKNYNRLANYEFLWGFVEFAIGPIVADAYLISFSNHIMLSIFICMLFFIDMDIFVKVAEETIHRNKKCNKKSIWPIRLLNGIKYYLSIYFLSEDIIKPLNDSKGTLVNVLLMVVSLIVLYLYYPRTKDIGKIPFKRPKGLNAFILGLLEANLTIFVAALILSIISFGIYVGVNIVTKLSLIL